MQYGTCHFTSKQAADRYYQQMGYSSADIPLAEGNIRIGEPALREGEIAKPDEDGRYHVWAPENVEKAPAVRPSATVSAPRRREDDRLASELELLTIEEGTIQLPSERLQCYAEIKRLIQKGGGRYDSRGYFKFPAGIDAAVILEELRCGNVVNGKKDSQSFFSPQPVARRVCEAAMPRPGRRYLEPSAGGGALADIVRAAGGEIVVVENHAPNVHILEGKGYDVLNRDFLTVSPSEIGLFDGVIANPPFSNNQDIDHIQHMWSFLKPGGCLSVVASTGWQRGSQRKHRAFIEFLEQNHAEIAEIEAGAFKESGTSVATVHICAWKTVPERAKAESSPRPSAAATQLALML
ncbi:MAG: hypothetical protein INH12_00525 [Cupriavidus sp.]|jgi:hypothetical protein|uniref:hypothetical protein n=1 Tax=Cupriavidus sp. TaxID=1873897 RepID=UPI0025B9197A|nr:hypothetical protein [Cupriavidus sp.]MCA3186383.1 hypothetical protein [Cupriavidus sp.]MCA3188556.1 hypothetical protein [Cupriavidus sp.]MCA3235194.1 hypothetical protein [Cupriavidus sp.]